MAKDTLDEAQLIKALRDRGFKVQKKGSFIKKTFELQEETLEAFMVETKKRGLKVKEAVDQALKAWIKQK